MADFFAELKRRHIYRVATAYTVVAWLLVQLVNNLAPIFELPVWIGRAVVLLLIVGLPVTLLTAWMRELAPADGASARVATSKLDWALMGALVVVIALVSYQQLASAPGARTAQQQASIAPVPGGISIAVLPFTNLSGDAGQEFFSDGMTEEITSALAKVPALRVVARTSAFAFKGQNRDIQMIAQALHASHLIEGSVRKDGNEVRITAQLIRADDGTHLWTESYDRELKGIFAVQEEIAQAIAASLQVPLGLKQGESLVSSRTGDTESYQNYLRAKALVRARNVGIPLMAAIALLETTVAREPNYAPAWALLAQAYGLAPNYDPVYQKGSVEELRRVVDAVLPKAEAAARRAIQLDPRSADAYAGLGTVQGWTNQKLLDAEQSFKQALSLDPLNPDALHYYSQIVAAAGRLKEALAMREQLRSLEPLVPVFNSVTDRILWAAGENDKALALAQALPSNNGQRASDMARTYAAMRRYKDAADAILTAPRGLFAPGAIETAAGLLRAAPAPAPRQEFPYLASYSFVYLYAGLPERALEFNEHNADAGYEVAVMTALIWHPDYAPARKTERFKTLVRKVGLVEYWRARGWSEFCHPTTGDDFVCD